MHKPFLRVLGSADWLPTKDNDGSCYTVSDEILVDTGWSVIVNMINHGLEPLDLHTICFTHMHADHYMALTQVILYWRIKRNSLEGLTLIGPKETLQAGFDRAFEYVFHDSHDVKSEVLGMPRIIPMDAGDVQETAHYRITCTPSLHAAPGLCYRMQHKETGHTIGFSGDTAYQEIYGSFFAGCDLLVHESSFGAGPLDPEANRICKHSSAQEAVRVAQEAGVRALLLTHGQAHRRAETVQAAKDALTIPVGWAEPYAVFDF